MSWTLQLSYNALVDGGFCCSKAAVLACDHKRKNHIVYNVYSKKDFFFMKFEMFFPLLTWILVLLRVLFFIHNSVLIYFPYLMYFVGITLCSCQQCQNSHQARRWDTLQTDWLLHLVFHARSKMIMPCALTLWPSRHMIRDISQTWFQWKVCMYTAICSRYNVTFLH